MKLITDYFNISGKLYDDLGYSHINNNNFNIDLIKLEKELEIHKYKIFISNNNTAFNIIKRVCKKYNIDLRKRISNIKNIDLKIWVDGEFEPAARISLYVNFNTDNSITSHNWNYFKKQLISKFIHEVVHFLRCSEDRKAWNDDEFHEYDIEKYLSSIEEQYSYSHEVIFELITNHNRSMILSWYNKKVKDETVLNHFSNLINKISKSPIFQNKIEVELV